MANYVSVTGTPDTLHYQPEKDNATYASKPGGPVAYPPVTKPLSPQAGAASNDVTGAASSGAVTLPPLSFSAAAPPWLIPVAIGAALVVALSMMRGRSSRGRR